VAAPFAPKVLNFLEISGGQQVMLQVRFAEVSRGAITNLGISTFFTDGRTQVAFQNTPGGNPVGALANNQPFTFDPTNTVFGSGHFASVSFEYFLSALKSNNLARILAEPNVVVMSGQAADFLAGGEIPVPVPQSGSGGGTTITIEYKQFGVKLNVVPIVLGEGRIQMKVAPEVSQLDFSNAVTLSGTQVPALLKRTVQTNVELGDGQTFAIAGLLNDTVQANRAGTPYLSDLPIIGALFSSVRYERKETELMVLVTPHLVSPLNPDEVPTLPGEHWRHPTTEQLLWKRDIGSEMPDKPSTKGTPGKPAGMKPAATPSTKTSAAPTEQTTPAQTGAPRVRGEYGFVPSTQESVLPTDEE
jgi:pilus assembly protein CpaC